MGEGNGKRAKPLVFPTVGRSEGGLGKQGSREEEDKEAPVVIGRVCGIECKLLLDSGAKVSVARYESFPDDVLKSLWRVNVKQSLIGITGHKVRIWGCYEMKIDLGVSAPFRHPIWIARGLDGLTVDVVLGQDVLRDREIDIFMARKEARCQGRVLPFQTGMREMRGREEMRSIFIPTVWTQQVRHVSPCLKIAAKDLSRRRSRMRSRNAKGKQGRKGGTVPYPRGIRDRVRFSKPATDASCQSDKGSLKQGIVQGQEEVRENSYRVVRLHSMEEVPGRAEILVSGSIEGIYPEALQVMVQPCGVGQPGILVASILATVRSQMVPLRIINTRKDTVRLPKGLVIAKTLPLQEEVQGIGSVEIKEDSDFKVVEQQAPKLRQVTLEEFSQNFELKHLSEDQRISLLTLLYEFRDTFRLPGDPLGFTDKVKHVIDTGDSPPIAMRPYRVPYKYKTELKESMQELLDEGVIRPSISPWAFPVVVVPKRDGGIRPCVDYRRLNAITRKEIYPLPLISETLDALGGARYFSAMDLASGYFQVALDEASIEKSAFILPHGNGRYEFLRMGMGLVNAPSTFQRLMDSILAGLQFEVCLIYLDDLIVFSKTFEEHLQRLRLVLQKLKENNLRLKSSKCSFLKNELEYLGHTVSAQGVKPQDEKIRAVAEYPTPKTVRDVRSFLGFVGFYRKFIPQFAEIARPLTQLTKVAKAFVWDEQAEEAFQKLRGALITAPILRFPDFSRRFILATDASGFAKAAVLSQEYNGKEFPVAFASRQFNQAELNYSTVERELAAVVFGISYFRNYLYGRVFLIITDHAPLRWLLKMKNPTNSRLARWSILLQDFEYDIVHRPGRIHSNVDALSRIRLPGRKDEEIAIDRLESRINFVGSAEENTVEWEPIYDMQRIVLEQNQDPKIKALREKLENQLGERKEDDSGYFLYADVLYYRHMLSSNQSTHEVRELIVVPRSMVRKVIELNHVPPLSAHLGYKKTIYRVNQQFIWEGMVQDVKKFVATCTSCQERKTSPHVRPSPLQRFTVVNQPFELVGMDILGPLPMTITGNRYLLLFTDYLSKWVEGIAIPNQKAKTVARALISEVIARHGVPQKLLTDRGANFLSALMKDVYSFLGIQKLNTTPYRPSTNGSIERFNRTLTQMLSHYTVDQHDWDEWLPFMLFAYRTAIHESTRETPFFLVYGRDAHLPFHEIIKPSRPNYMVLEDYKAELIARLRQAFERAREQSELAKERRKIYYDKRARQSDLKSGDLILLYTPVVGKGLTHKLTKPWKGPYRIVEQIGPVTFRIQKPEGRETQLVHANRLKKFYEPINFPYDPVEKAGRMDKKEFRGSIIPSEKEHEETEEFPEVLDGFNDTVKHTERRAKENAKYALRSQGPVPDLPWVLRSSRESGLNIPRQKKRVRWADRGD